MKIVTSELVKETHRGLSSSQNRQRPDSLMGDKTSGISEVLFRYERKFRPLGDICCPSIVLKNSIKSIRKSGQSSGLIESRTTSQWTQLLMPGLHIKRFKPSLPFDRTPMN